MDATLQQHGTGLPVTTPHPHALATNTMAPITIGPGSEPDKGGQVPIHIVDQLLHEKLQEHQMQTHQHQMQMQMQMHSGLPTPPPSARQLHYSPPLPNPHTKEALKQHMARRRHGSLDVGHAGTQRGRHAEQGTGAGHTHHSLLPTAIPRPMSHESEDPRYAPFRQGAVQQQYQQPQQQQQQQPPPPPFRQPLLSHTQSRMISRDAQHPQQQQQQQQRAAYPAITIPGNAPVAGAYSPTPTPSLSTLSSRTGSVSLPRSMPASPVVHTPVRSSFSGYAGQQQVPSQLQTATTAAYSRVPQQNHVSAAPMAQIQPAQPQVVPSQPQQPQAPATQVAQPPTPTTTGPPSRGATAHAQSLLTSMTAHLEYAYRATVHSVASELDRQNAEFTALRESNRRLAELSRQADEERVFLRQERTRLLEEVANARVALAASAGGAPGEGEVGRLRAENAKLRQLNNVVLQAAYGSGAMAKRVEGEEGTAAARGVDPEDVVMMRIGALVAPRGLVKAIESSIREPIVQAYEAQLAQAMAAGRREQDTNQKQIELLQELLRSREASRTPSTSTADSSIFAPPLLVPAQPAPVQSAPLQPAPVQPTPAPLPLPEPEPANAQSIPTPPRTATPAEPAPIKDEPEDGLATWPWAPGEIIDLTLPDSPPAQPAPLDLDALRVGLGVFADDVLPAVESTAKERPTPERKRTMEEEDTGQEEKRKRVRVGEDVVMGEEIAVIEDVLATPHEDETPSSSQETAVPDSAMLVDAPPEPVPPQVPPVDAPPPAPPANAPPPPAAAEPEIKTEEDAPAPARPTLSIKHIDLAYHTSTSEMTCRMCYKRKGVDPHWPVASFPLSTLWPVLARHCEEVHPAGFESLVSLDPGTLAETRERLLAIDGGRGVRRG